MSALWEAAGMSELKERLLGGPRWEESIWAYRLWNWRCQLFGHRWGTPEEEYEDIYHVATRCYCQREKCDRSEEIWNVWNGDTGR